MAEPRKALRGRFIRRGICESNSVATLIKRRGYSAGLLHIRLALWSDDEGRFDPNPLLVKAHCFPLHHYALSRITKDLQVMHELELICLYTVKGRQWAYFPNWHKHQPKQKPDRFIPSELPAPPLTKLEAKRRRLASKPEPVRLPEVKYEVKREVKVVGTDLASRQSTPKPNPTAETLRELAEHRARRQASSPTPLGAILAAEGDPIP